MEPQAGPAPHQAMSSTTGVIFVLALLIVLVTNNILHFVIATLESGQ